jgi:hypothetical protein
MGQTLYGADLNGGVADIQKAIPEQRKPFFESFVNARKEDRAKILGILPRLERRVLQAKWGMPVEAKPDLGQYFKTHHLPSKYAGIWNPYIDMSKMNIKIAEANDMNPSDFGYYPQEVQGARSYPTIAPNMNAPNYSDMADTLRGALGDYGVENMNISVSPSSYPGINFTGNIKKDITDKIREYLNG